MKKLATYDTIKKIVKYMKGNFIRTSDPIFRQPSTAYSVGDVVYVKGAGAKYYLLCVTAGTTTETDIDMTGVADGATVTDGTVTWTIRTVASTADISGRADRSLSNLTDAGLAKLVGNVSKEANGYLTFENGLIIQWGRYIENTAATTVTYYPIAFPNVCLALTVTPGSSVSEDVTVTISSNQTAFPDRFTWATWKANAYDTIPGNASISYIAIGY